MSNHFPIDEPDEFHSEDERQECVIDLVGLDRAGLTAEDRDMWGTGDGATHRRIWRKARKAFRQAKRQGVRDPGALKRHVEEMIKGDKSIVLTTLLLAVLSAVIQWLVTRWLDRWNQPEVGAAE